MVAIGAFDERRTPAAGVVSRAFALDLDDVGAEVGEHLSGPRPSQNAGKFEYRRPASGFGMELSLSFIVGLIRTGRRSRPYTLSGVEEVPQAVAEQVEGEHGQADGDAPGRGSAKGLTVKVRRVARQHQTPGGGRFLHAKTEERQRGFRQDRLGNEGRQHDEVGRHDVRRHVTEDNASVGVAGCARSIDIGHHTHGKGRRAHDACDPRHDRNRDCNDQIQIDAADEELAEGRDHEPAPAR